MTAALKKLHPLFLAALEGRVFASLFHPQAQQQIDTLRARMLELHEQSRRLSAKATRTDLEQAELDRLNAEFDLADAEVRRVEVLARPQPRKVGAGDLPEHARISGGYKPGASRESWGWQSPGEYGQAVVNAAKGRPDPRLLASASTYGAEGSNSDGGYAVPPDFREQITATLEGETSLLALTDQIPTMSNKLTIPRDAVAPWNQSDGVKVAWGAEAATIDQSKPKLEIIECPLNKLVALIPLTDELMEDAPALAAYLPSAVGNKFTSMLNAAIVAGDGSGKPSGLLDSGSLVTVDIENSQTLANAIVWNNIVKMWARLYAPLRRDAFWLINADLEPFLLSMVIPSSGVGLLAYPPPGADASQVGRGGLLMGRPVIPAEACSALGTPGDIILCAGKQYLSATKVSGLRQTYSLHCFFDQDMGALRFVLRVGGQSKWDAPATRNNGNTVSNIVTLDTRGS